MRAIAESAAKPSAAQCWWRTRHGASGMFGPNELVKAAPDGYTLSQPLTIGVASFATCRRCSLIRADGLFTLYIACLTGYFFGIVVRSDSPIKSIKDLVEYAKQTPRSSPTVRPAQEQRHIWLSRSSPPKPVVSLRTSPGARAAEGAGGAWRAM